MKKYLLFSLSLFFFAGTGLFGQEENSAFQESEEIIFSEQAVGENQLFEETEDINGIKKEIGLLIKNGLQENKEKISSLSQKLPEEEKLLLFKTYESDAKTARQENMWPGYGLGSLWQGNFTPFLPHLLVDGIGSLALYTGGMGILIFGIVDFIPFLSTKGEVAIFKDYYLPLLGIMGGGLAVMLTSRLISLIWPNLYATKYNANLKEALNMDDWEESISVNPVIIPDKNFRAGLAVTMKMN